MGSSLTDQRIHHRLGLLLVFALLFAALHLATHDLVSGDAGQTACQICHLSHAPGAQLPPPAPVFSALAATFVLALPTPPAAPRGLAVPRQARAPPFA